jgi:hypothetical protein
MLDNQNYPMDNYMLSNEDFGDIPDYPSIIGQKRQRLSDGSTAVKNEGYPGQRMMHQGSIGSMSESPHGGSLDDFDECNQQKTIRFGGFEQQTWNTLYDQNRQELSPWKVSVVADKGFNYSSSDNCFVNQVCSKLCNFKWQPFVLEEESFPNYGPHQGDKRESTLLCDERRPDAARSYRF